MNRIQFRHGATQTPKANDRASPVSRSSTGSACADPREAHMIETMPDALYEAAKDALTAYGQDGDKH
jgi:hypothetical protein